jgi:hypothetical protein
MATKHAIVADDILPMADYAKVRGETRRRIAERKRNRRVTIGPYVTFYFECYETMWLQVHEMIFIEKGGPEQIPDELHAYNPLVPKGAELVATFMIEIDDAERRKRELGKLGGIEEKAFIQLGTERIPGIAEADQDRTTAEGKASSVQFVHFSFTPAQIASFKAPGTQVVLGLSHPNYGHMAVLPEAVRQELASDFD